MHTVIWALSQYGYIALFLLLALGIIGLPIPDETLMVFVGSLTVNGPFHYATAFIVCFIGSLTGMFVSYMVGYKVGKPLLDRYGKRIKLTPARVAEAEHWFRKYGLWSIVFGYFVPGLRHLTCYMAGMSRMQWTTYLLAAGSGALLWVTTFLTIGHIVGDNWSKAVAWVHEKGSPVLWVALALLLIGGFLFWYYRIRNKKEV